MFYRKTLKVPKEEEKTFEFDMFASTQNSSDDETTLKVGEPKKVYNFICEDGTLKNGYGFKPLAMPTSESDVENESEIAIRGNEVKTIWKLKWYNSVDDINCYYLFYFNDEGNICYDNLFRTRYATLIQPTSYTETPYATHYRKSGNDAILLSGEGGNLMVITGSNTYTSDTAPKIISCCNHYGKLFAITATARGTLVYNDNSDILTWEDDKTKDLDFSDERGDLNKIMSFNDYLFLFRDFGITQVSEYGINGEFAISHIYKSDAYIYPNTIAEAGGKIYFLEGEKLKVFNGSSVKELELNCMDLIKGEDNRFAFGECFNGKYYLACRGNFGDDKKIGCEASESGFNNNILMIIDTDSAHVDVVRGVDINELLALTNKHKSKLVACYYHENIGKIGEITTQGKIFDEISPALWQSGKTDFGYGGKNKRVKFFFIKTEGDCIVTLESDKQTKSFAVKGKDRVQKIRANVLGNQFTVKIESKDSENVYISNFLLTVSVG